MVYIIGRGDSKSQVQLVYNQPPREREDIAYAIDM